MTSLVISSYQQAKIMKQEAMWQQLKHISVSQAIQMWIDGLVFNTAQSYRYGMDTIAKYGILDLDINLQEFSLKNHSISLEKIKDLQLSEATRQSRASCYISFTRYLNDLTGGLVGIAVAKKTGGRRTFPQIREKVKTEVLTKKQWQDILRILQEMKFNREYIIACLLLHGGKRITEVLNLKIENINFSKNEITFLLLKTTVLNKYTIITYPQEVIDKIIEFIAGRKYGYVFINSQGNRIAYCTVLKNLKRVGKEIGINLITHMFRTSCITYMRLNNVPDHDIMKITGHTSIAGINQYDKNSLSDNYTKRINLIRAYDDSNQSDSRFA